MTRLLEHYIAAGVEPFPLDDDEDGYRCSAELVDGTYLPCVMIRRRKPLVDLAVRRLEEEKAGAGIFRTADNPYREMLSHFVTSGNKVNGFEIKRVTASRYAIPFSLLQNIASETVMAWTGFVLEMNDGKRFAFGTSFLFAFFDLPEGYEFDNVRAVFNHSYLTANEELRLIHEDVELWRASAAECTVYRSRPYFDCFI